MSLSFNENDKLKFISMIMNNNVENEVVPACICVFIVHLFKSHINMTTIYHHRPSTLMPKSIHFKLNSKMNDQYGPSLTLDVMINSYKTGRFLQDIDLFLMAESLITVTHRFKKL